MLRDNIRDTPEYQTIAGKPSANGQTDGAEPTRQASGQPATVGNALAPVMNWEKGDVLFWTQVAQLAVLLLIYREIRRRGL